MEPYSLYAAIGYSFYDEDGNLVDYPLGDGNMNPLADMGEDQYVNNVKTLSVAPQIYVELTPLKGLSFKSLLMDISEYERK